MSGAEIAKLPDPDLFRDAHLLAQTVAWSPAELDATDELLVQLVTMFRSAVPSRES